MREEIQNSQIPPAIVVQEWAKSIKKKSDVKCNFFQTASDVPDPRDLNSEDKNLMNEHNLLPWVEPKNKRSKSDNYDRLKTIRNNPREVTVKDFETDEIKTFPSIYGASKFLDTSSYTVYYWGNKNGAWKNKYEIIVT